MFETWKKAKHPFWMVAVGGGIGTYASTMLLLRNAPGTWGQKNMFASIETVTWPVRLFPFNVTERYFKAIGLHRNDYAAYLREKYPTGNR